MTKIMDNEVSNKQYVLTTNMIYNTFGKSWHDISFDVRRDIIQQFLNEQT